MSRISSRDLPPTWTLRCAYPDISVMFLSEPRYFISHLTATYEQARRYRERSQRQYGKVTWRGDYFSGRLLFINGLEITRDEAIQIRNGGNPHAVLLGPVPSAGRYWLVVVPWRQ